MEKLLDQLTEEVEKAFGKAGFSENFGQVVLSNRPDLCEFQCNGAMAAAKEYHMPPSAIADAVAECLTESSLFAAAESVKPGFLNLTLSEQFLASYVNAMAEDTRCGAERPGAGHTMIVDYGGANVAKPLHIGHLRSAIIGESVKRLGQFLGYHTIGDVHLGDWGLQMGLIIEEVRDRQPELVYFDSAYVGAYPEKAPFTIGELEEIYPAASKKAKEDASFAARAHEATLRLQDGYAPYRALWRHIMEVSIADLKKNYDRLHVQFDLWKGESDAQEYIPGVIRDLSSRGIARESEGALVVDIAEEGDAKELPPCIVRKSDGASLYATSDIATIVEREKDFSPDEYIYLADKRQQLHFTQVFRTVKKAGYVSPETPMIHIGFGTMNGADGKPFKTREGGVMRLEYLIDDINEAAYARIRENRDISEEEARATAEMVGLAALKYGDLSNQASKDYVFDLERFLSFEGNTGPYLLYTIVRMKSILKKYAEAGGNESGAKILSPRTAQERELMLVLTRFNGVMEEAFADTAPHKVCAYLYDLANAFNRFYHNTKIIAEGDAAVQGSEIRLLTLTKRVLECGIEILGFEAPERM